MIVLSDCLPSIYQTSVSYNQNQKKKVRAKMLFKGRILRLSTLESKKMERRRDYQRALNRKKLTTHQRVWSQHKHHVSYS